MFVIRGAYFRGGAYFLGGLLSEFYGRRLQTHLIPIPFSKRVKLPILMYFTTLCQQRSQRNFDVTLYERFFLTQNAPSLSS